MHTSWRTSHLRGSCKLFDEKAKIQSKNLTGNRQDRKDMLVYEKGRNDTAKDEKVEDKISALTGSK